MFVSDLIAAFAIATVFTIAFCGMLGGRNFRWHKASLSTLLLIVFSWMAAASVIALVPLLSGSRASVNDLMTGIAVFAGLALMASRRIRRALRVILEPAHTAARFSVLLVFLNYFVAAFYLCFNPIRPRASVLSRDEISLVIANS